MIILAFLFAIGVLFAFCFIHLLVRIGHAFSKFYAWKITIKCIYIAICVILYFVLTILQTVSVQCGKGAEINYYYIRHNWKKIFDIFHIMCFLPLWYVCSLFHINVFYCPVRILQGVESFEVLGLRLTDVNFVLNPRRYILLSKETVLFLQRFHCMQKCCRAKDHENTTKKVPL